MAILGLLLAFGAIIAFEVPGLIENSLWRELVIFSVLLIIGFIYSLGAIYDIHLLPNPTKTTEFIFKPPADAIVNMLKR